nr:serine hydrolase domain-containing protein [Nocardiopsis sp. CNR-923]
MTSPHPLPGLPRRVPRPPHAAMRVAVVLAAVIAVLIPTTATAAGDDGTGAPPALTSAAIDALVHRHQEASGTPGIAVAVTQGTRVVHARGYGTTPSGQPVTARTPMALASVSKSFTAMAVLQLVESGDVDLDEPVVAYLPEFTMADPRAARITVRQLLDQTSGMSDTTFPAFTRDQPDTLREAVASMRTGRLAADPGTRHEYHNPNFQVAARLVEVVTGRPFAERLQDSVLDPLGMHDSTTLDTERDLPASAHGHLKLLGRPVARPNHPPSGTAPAAWSAPPRTWEPGWSRRTTAAAAPTEPASPHPGPSPWRTAPHPRPAPTPWAGRWARPRRARRSSNTAVTCSRPPPTRRSFPKPGTEWR